MTRQTAEGLLEFAIGVGIGVVTCWQVVGGVMKSLRRRHFFGRGSAPRAKRQRAAAG